MFLTDEDKRLRINARQKLHYWLRKGHIARAPCQVCGDPETEAHHDDYSKPLEVIWLCKTHHGLVRREEVPLKGTWLYQMLNHETSKA
jgi:hypothetical protein